MLDDDDDDDDGLVCKCIIQFIIIFIFDKTHTQVKKNYQPNTKTKRIEIGSSRMNHDAMMI